jgi:hypothetical protein
VTVESLNDIHYNPATSTFLLVVSLAFENFSDEKHILAYRKHENGILLYRKGKLTIAKSK